MLRASTVVRPALMIALVVVLFIALVLTVLWLAQRRLIYQPAREDLPAAAQVFPGGRDVILRPRAHGTGQVRGCQRGIDARREIPLLLVQFEVHVSTFAAVPAAVRR